MTDWSEYQDDISDAISESVDIDWNAGDGARAVVRWLNENVSLTASANDALALRTMLDNLVIAQGLSKEIREHATDAARSYLYNTRAMLSAAPAPEGGAATFDRDALITLIMEETTDDIVADGWDRLGKPNVLVQGCRYIRRNAPPSPEGYANPEAAAKQFAGFIADRLLAAREEAPAEAGEDVNWKAEYEAACAARISDRQKSQEVINERDKWVAELLQERAALHAQTQAREDAQPFGYWVTHPVGENPMFIRYGSFVPADDRYTVQPLYTHPAPDALRVAVEALETTRNRINTWPIDDHETCMCGSTIEAHDIGSGHFPVSQADHAVSTIVAEINKALAALQAEQKGDA